MNWQQLLDAAQDARTRAYATYSKYPVGAAILDQDGLIWTGCNVENVSFGLTLCAERTALVKMVSSGTIVWKALAVVTKDGGTPCGACLQVLSEFGDGDAQVAVAAEGGEIRVFRFSDLLPHGFRSEL